MTSIKRTLTAFSLTVTAALSTACTQLSFATANLPTYFSDVHVTHNIAYGDDAIHKMDIYQPSNAAADTPAPVIIFFYGGRWTFGERQQYKFAGNKLAKRGYVVVIPDYSKYPNVKFPTFVKDGAAATAWVYNNIDQYNGNPDALFLSGHSSGAHIASLIAADASYLSPYKLSPAIINGFAGLSGPYDFTPQENDLKNMFGPPSQYPVMRTTTHINGDAPPMLLMHGGDDETVGQFNMDNLAIALRNHNIPVETKIYPNVDHVAMVGSLSWVLNHKASTVDDMDIFFRSHLPPSK